MTLMDVGVGVCWIGVEKTAQCKPLQMTIQLKACPPAVLVSISHGLASNRYLVESIRKVAHGRFHLGVELAVRRHQALVLVLFLAWHLL